MPLDTVSHRWVCTGTWGPDEAKQPGGTLRSPGRLEAPGSAECPSARQMGTEMDALPMRSMAPSTTGLWKPHFPWTTRHQGKQARWGCGRCPVTLKALSSSRQSPPPSRPCMRGARETSPIQALQRSPLAPVLLSCELHLTMIALSAIHPSRGWASGNTDHGCSLSKVYERL